MPTIIVAGPLFGAVAGRWVPLEAPDTFDAPERDDSITRPSFGVTLATVLLPVVLMLGNNYNGDEQNFRDLIGQISDTLSDVRKIVMFTVPEYEPKQAEVNKVLLKSPDLAQAHALKGELLEGRRLGAKSLAEYQRALELRPDDEPTWEHLATL